MSKTSFHTDLEKHLRNGDTASAQAVIMSELGRSLVKNKSAFVELLTLSGLPANDSMSDMSLVNLFVDNIHGNRKLLLGSAFLVNFHNKQSGFDGEEVNDGAVKATYNTLYSFFDSKNYPEEEYHSNLGGPIAGIAQAALGIGKTVAEGQYQKKYGSQDMLAKQQASKQALVASILDQRKAQAEAARSKQEHKQKMIKIAVISGAGLVVVVGIILAVKYYKKHKK